MKHKALYIAAGVAAFLLIGGAVSCNRPSPAPSVPSPPPSSTATQRATATSAPTSTRALPTPQPTIAVTATPVILRTVLPLTTAIPIAATATPTAPPRPPIVVVPDTGHPTAGDGASPAWLYVIAGLLLPCWGVLWRWWDRGKR